MNALGRLLGFVFGIFGFGRRSSRGRPRVWRPSFPIHQDFVPGQLSAGDIYRLLHDRARGTPGDAIPV